MSEEVSEFYVLIEKEKKVRPDKIKAVFLAVGQLFGRVERETGKELKWKALEKNRYLISWEAQQRNKRG